MPYLQFGFRLPRNEEGLALRTTPYFKRSLTDAVALFLNSKSIDDVANALEVPKGNLIYIAYRAGGVGRYYKEFSVKKRNGGNRIIMAPTGGLRIIHQKLHTILQNSQKSSPCVHAFCAGKSIVTNARSHRKPNYVFNVDLEDFFRSIHFGRVSGMFRKVFRFEKQTSDFLAHLCCYKGALPQGSPCSPAISNLVSYSLDKEMLKLARDHRLVYTRYADDLTFSIRGRRFPASVGYFLGNDRDYGPAEAGPQLSDAVTRAGFTINNAKTRLQSRRHNQTVTGLTVNEFPNVSRHRIRYIRKLIHLMEKFGGAKAAEFMLGKGKTEKDYLQLLFGHLAFLKSVRGSNDALLKNFCAEMRKVTTQCPKWVTKAAAEFQVKDIFLSHASEDKDEIALPIFKACEKKGLSVFYDAQSIDWGDSIVEKINKGLGEAKIFVPIITPNFLEKKWPRAELNSAFSRFMNAKNRILPIVHDVANMDDYPLMNDILYKTWKSDPNYPDEIAQTLLLQVGKF